MKQVEKESQAGKQDLAVLSGSLPKKLQIFFNLVFSSLYSSFSICNSRWIKWKMKRFSSTACASDYVVIWTRGEGKSSIAETESNKNMIEVVALYNTKEYYFYGNVSPSRLLLTHCYWHWVKFPQSKKHVFLMFLRGYKNFKYNA